MHKVDPKIQAQLWERDGDQIVGALQMMLRGPGLARQKGKSAAQVKEEAFTELLKIAYLGGLARGYHMGFCVASPDDGPAEDDGMTETD